MASATAANAAPPPPRADLSTLPTSQLKAIRSNLLSEHFLWSPESFTKSAMDIANSTLELSTSAAEDLLLSSLAAAEAVSTSPSTSTPEGGEERRKEVGEGVYRLVTLLESVVDKSFDLYEIFVLRNTFRIEDELIPYVVLEHQKPLLAATTTPPDDDAAWKEYEREVEAYEVALTQSKQLAATLAWYRNRLEHQEHVALEVGAFKASEPLAPLTASLSNQLTSLSTSLSSLLSTPLPSSSTSSSSTDPTTQSRSEEDPFGQSRDAFINWAAGGKVKDELGGDRGGGGSSMSVVDGGGVEGRRGGGEDAAALLSQLGGGASSTK